MEAAPAAFDLDPRLTWTHKSSGVIPFLSATYLAPRDKRICAVSRCPWLQKEDAALDAGKDPSAAKARRQAAASPAGEVQRRGS